MHVYITIIIVYIFIYIYIHSIRTYKQYNSIIMLYKYSILYSQLIYAVEKSKKQRQVWQVEWTGELGVVWCGELRCSVDSSEDVRQQGQHQPREKNKQRERKPENLFDIKLNQEHKKYSPINFGQSLQKAVRMRFLFKGGGRAWMLPIRS